MVLCVSRRDESGEREEAEFESSCGRSERRREVVSVWMWKRE